MAKGRSGSWYSTGKDGMAKSKQEDEAQKQRREQQKDMPWRFRLNSNEEHVKFVLLDTPMFFIREHNLQIGGKYGNYFTCITDFDTCPLDTLGNSSYGVAATGIDTRTWTDSKDVEHKNQKRLVVFKGKAREKIVRMIESKKDLQYAVLEFSRGSGATESATGEDIEFLKKLTREQLKGFVPKGETMKWLDPFDYAKILAPKSLTELSKLAGTASPVGSGTEETEEKEDGKTGKGKKAKKERKEEKIDDIDDLL